MMGGWMSALGGAGGIGSLGGAAGGAAKGAGGWMGTMKSIGKGLGDAAGTFNAMGGFTGQRGGGQGGVPASGWQTPAQTGLADEIKRQLELMKQEDIMKRLSAYQPYEDRGGIEGLTINPYR